MDLVCRVMFDAQQEYFTWANAVATVANVAAARAVPLPDFDPLTNKLDTYRVDSLSTLPSQWYTLFGAPLGTNNSPGEGQSAARNQSGTAAVVNANADSRLMRRFAQSDFQSISAMVEAGGDEVSIPKLNDKDVCLVWALLSLIHI